MMRLVLPLLMAAACANPEAKPPAAHPAQGMTAARPVAPVRSEEDYAAERAEFDALEAGARERAPRRAALEKFLLDRVNHALDGGHYEDAWDDLKPALTLYDADELLGAITDAPLLSALQKFERALRSRGAHQLVLAALAAQEALGDAGARARFKQVTGWLRHAADGTH